MKMSKIECKNCNKQFDKADKEIRKSTTGNHFCSRSCSSSYNNKTPKRKLTKVCKSCNSTVPFNRKYCDPCLKKYHNSLKSPKLCIDCNKQCTGLRCRDCYLSHHYLNRKMSSNVKYEVCIDCGCDCPRILMLDLF